ncbi:MAG: hypothetical protein JAZ12_00470 [Candidatus Thiodiazotropha taylori]|nr:hypothetical protein [Candidatus Thiodiazotropha taylori]
MNTQTVPAWQEDERFALLSKPRVNLTRLHSVFAASSEHRVGVTLGKRGKGGANQQDKYKSAIAPPNYDLSTATETDIQHRCVDLTAVWR